MKLKVYKRRYSILTYYLWLCDIFLTKKKTKTFRADVTPGLATDIDNLQKSIGATTHTDFLKIVVKQWQRYEYFYYEQGKKLEEMGIDIHRNALKKTKGTTVDSQINNKMFGLMMYMTGLNKKQRKQYLKKLESDMSAKEILEWVTNVMED